MRADRGVEFAALAGVAAMDKAVFVSAGGAAFRGARIFFV
jgi:hypothetical protein